MAQSERDVEPLLKRVTPLPYRLGILLGDQDGRADFSRQIPQRNQGAKQETPKERQAERPTPFSQGHLAVRDPRRMQPL